MAKICEMDIVASEIFGPAVVIHPVASTDDQRWITLQRSGRPPIRPEERACVSGADIAADGGRGAGEKIG